eukprot:TRINITY_DN747_c0_g2_i1.p1 TRINITY_DN747_c0_g2~~TRINITY_DN747_c0_g2_i1.p1  ORF type:complete len:837 (-),score=223.96 TRINITY_DN747_c0_g2_i1:167-2677(-)
MRGFTCGIDDMLLMESSEKARGSLLDVAHSPSTGLSNAEAFNNRSKSSSEDKKKKTPVRTEREKKNIVNQLKSVLEMTPAELENWDSFMIGKAGGVTSSVIDACPDLVKKFPKNNFSLMTVSGAKGSRVNFSMISCLLGQQELEGRRVPLMVTGKSLPCFQPYDPSLRAGGFVGDRFLTGVRPQEYYFHCMAGREGLVDTAVKTSRSGYLQRCIIKHLEGLTVNYDQTVRDSDGSVIQFHYGEDGIDVTKSPFLKKFDFLTLNKSALVDQLNPKEAMSFMKTVSHKDVNKVKKSLAQLPKTNAKRQKKALPLAAAEDPILTQFLSSTHIGSISEEHEEELTTFIEKTFPNDKKAAAEFRTLMYLKYRRSLAHPGENVGTLAGQSIGEPSTQMTLNTFHLAGRGDINVTLGIPRLRELLMATGSRIKTPYMILPLKKEYSNATTANEIAKRLQSIPLSEVIKFIRVKETLDSDSGGRHFRKYEVEISFLDFTTTTSVNWEQFRDRVESGFVAHLDRVVVAMVKKSRPPPVGKVSEKFAYIDSVASSIVTEEVALSAKEKKNMKRKEEADELGTLANRKAEGLQYDEDDAVSVEEKESNYLRTPTSPTTDNEDDDEDSSRINVSPYLHTYSFDKDTLQLSLELHLPANKMKLLMVSIIETEAARFLVQEVANLDKCAVLSPSKEQPTYTLQTAGINFPQIWRLYSLLDMNKCYSNDLAQVLNHYGIEAARRAIIREVGGVFGAYGIDVNYRHLSLIADYMTHEGNLKPFNRLGIRSNVSPLLKMSFETTMQFLTDSVLYGDYDTLQSPSAQISFGLPATVGTSSFELRQDLVVAVKDE